MLQLGRMQISVAAHAQDAEDQADKVQDEDTVRDITTCTHSSVR